MFFLTHPRPSRPIVSALTLCFSLLLVLTPQANATTEAVDFRYPALNELSGLASSNFSDTTFWAHNDSGDRARLFRLDRSGQVRGEVAISGAGAFDWEDIASFVDHQGRPMVLIGDIGDNASLRPFITLYLLAEPSDTDTEAKVIRSYTLSYPDGARDAESLAVDSKEGYVYLLSKRDAHPRLYRFPLTAEARFIPLEYLGEVRSIPNVAEHDRVAGTGGFRFCPSAMSFTASGDAALIVTPDKSYYYPRQSGQSWLSALNQNPVVLNPGRLPQTEAGGFSRDGDEIIIGSEGKPARVRILPRPSHSPSYPNHHAQNQ